MLLLDISIARVAMPWTAVLAVVREVVLLVAVELPLQASLLLLLRLKSCKQDKSSMLGIYVYKISLKRAYLLVREARSYPPSCIKLLYKPPLDRSPLDRPLKILLLSFIHFATTSGLYYYIDPNLIMITSPNLSRWSESIYRTVSPRMTEKL
jgi:hypothetical protein